MTQATSAPPTAESEAGSSALTADLMASVVVFLVALPLCMGIAIASGVPPVLGLITGIVGGLVVGSIAGSPLQVSGPAAGLAVIVFEIVQQKGLVALGVIVFLAGLIQLAAGLMKLGQWFRAVSPAVIKGMLAGIGVLIFSSQFHVMLDDAPKGKGWENLVTIPQAIYSGIFPLDFSQHHQAAGLGIITIAALVSWTWLTQKQHTWAPHGLRRLIERVRMVPAALVAIILATAVATLGGLQVNLIEIPKNLIDEINWTGTIYALPTMIGESTIITAALAMALIASAESLLCATATDQMQTAVRTDYDRELAAQGVGNTICGLVGALPMTGVIVRSSANVQAGAKTRASAILHGLWLLLFVAALPFLLQLIPRSALAGLLVYIGYRLVDPVAIRKIKSYGWTELGIYLATVVAIVATDLLTGVLTGLGLAAAKLLYQATRLSVVVEDQADGSVRVDLHGTASFLGLPRLAQALEAIPHDKKVVIEVGPLAYADPAIQTYLEGFEHQHEAKGGEVVLHREALAERSQPKVGPNRGRSPETVTRTGTLVSSTDDVADDLVERVPLAVEAGS